jgi:cytochrome c biogenesis protein CcdA
MIAVAIALLSGRLQQRLALAGGGLGGLAEGWIGRVAPEGWQGQLVIGVLLGIIWVPCIGPTLGAASLMASRGENLMQVATVMTLFGLGAAAPLLLIGGLSREALMRWRGRMGATGNVGKHILGVIVLLVGLGIVTGLEKRFQAWVITVTPDWLTELTTRY